MIWPSLLKQTVLQYPYPLLFATISGAHLYGFPSADSDFDLRGVHILPTEEVIGLETPRETIELSTIEDGIELDLVTHDIKKFFLLLLKKNGYVLEQLYSPLIMQTSAEHKELKTIAKGCITRHHCHHYLGFSSTQWRLFSKEQPPRLKPLLYVYRTLLTGIHLMQTGEIEANLVKLNESFKLPHISDLISYKLLESEQHKLIDVDIEFHEREFIRLRELLEVVAQRSNLVEEPTTKPALNDLLKRIRVNKLHGVC